MTNNKGTNLNNDLIIKMCNMFNDGTLSQIITDMSVVSWDRRLEVSQLNKWLENFDGQILDDSTTEKMIACLLLMNFTFYTYGETRILCKYIFEDYLHHKLVQYEEINFMQESPISERITDILKKTIFLSLGNPSESSSNLLYYFRQENSLSTQAFKYNCDQTYENLVYIDDMIISGSQASAYIDCNECLYDIPNKFILTLIASNCAIDHLMTSNPAYKSISAILLDDRSKCFSGNTFIFSQDPTQSLYTLALKMCKGYGERLFSNHPLGYKDGQYLFGFFYNTPDNTLPIIWSNNNWNPIFPRYQKKYTEGEVKVNESKYF